MGMALLAGALALTPLTARAQEAPPTSNTPATDAIGPKALQNFSLNGTVTRAADQPVAVPPAPEKRQPRSQAQTAPQPATGRPASAPPRQTAAAPATPPPRAQSEAPVPTADATAQPLRQSPPSSSVTVALPNLQGAAATSAAPPPSFAPAPESSGALAAGHGISMLPWLLAALAVAIGGAFLLWRNRSREAFAGGPQVDAFVAPEPATPPAAAPAPRAEPPRAPPAGEVVDPSSLGFVSTRLRPWIEIGFRPTRCVLEDQRVLVDFELELFNSGSAPARGVLVEASLFNAGPTQDEQIGNFFANPVGAGERIVAIPPLQRVAVRTQVIAPREQIQAYELGGREVFIPLIAFNALYSWSSGEGQTSVSYLLGRDTKGEKMGPFRLDLGPRIFRDVAARLLPDGVRQ